MIKDTILYLVLLINYLLQEIGYILGVFTSGFFRGYKKGERQVTATIEYFQFKRIAALKNRDSNRKDDDSDSSGKPSSR